MSLIALDAQNTSPYEVGTGKCHSCFMKAGEGKECTGITQETCASHRGGGSLHQIGCCFILTICTCFPSACPAGGCGGHQRKGWQRLLSDTWNYRRRRQKRQDWWLSWVEAYNKGCGCTQEDGSTGAHRVRGRKRYRDLGGRQVSTLEVKRKTRRLVVNEHVS